MKQSIQSSGSKIITVDINDSCLQGGGSSSRSDKTVVVRFTANGTDSITLNDIANAIICCISGAKGVIPIDSNRFNQLNVYVDILKGASTVTTYHFFVPDFMNKINNILSILAKSVVL